MTTLDALAGLDYEEAAFRDRYLPEVTHQRKPLERLAQAARRARMLKADIDIERITEGPIVVPRADVEIDVDIEWDADSRVYLWGVLVRRHMRLPEYIPFVEWGPIGQERERSLATEFLEWLRREVAAADAAGLQLVVYHYNHTERSTLTRLLGEAAVADLLPRFVDLLDYIRQNFFGAEGLSIKQVAPAFGFSWRDEAPSGLASQQWLVAARRADAADERDDFQKRIRQYNEDDVRATAAVREALSPQP